MPKNGVFRFLADRSGNFAMTFGVVIFPIMFMTGIAVDYSNISRERSRLQETADSAAFYAVKELEKAGYSENDLEAEADKMVSANFDIDGVVDASAEYDQVANLLTVRLVKDYDPAFLKLMTSDPITLHVLAQVTYGEKFKGAKCMMTLSETGKGVFNLNGNAVIDARKCSVHVNSSSADAVDLNGNGTSLYSASNCFVGGVQSGLTRIQPPPEETCYVLPDPFDQHKMPTVGKCDYYDFKLTGGGSKIMNPGVYCGGISVGAGLTVTLNPGIYIVKDGVFKTTGTVSLTGNGVGFFFTGTGIAVQFSGGTTFKLKAMKYGVIAGFIFFFDPNSDLSQTSSFSGNSSTYFEGVLYFGRRNVTVDGTGEVNTGSPFSSIVANTLTLNGNATINFAVDENATDLPIPEELYEKIISPYLVR